MSINNDGRRPKGSYEIGYQKPPEEHRFKKGTSGNRNGRPRKAVPALTTRQLRRDIIDLGERLTTIQTGEGPRKVPIIEGIMLRLAQKAMSGHGPSMRKFIDLYQHSVRDHNEIHKRFLSFIEIIEFSAVEKPPYPGTERDIEDFLNRLRKKSRRI